MQIALKLLSIILLPFLVGISIPDKKAATADLKIDFNPEHLDGRFTGGFGEQTCHSCHFDYDLNQEGGSLAVEGINDEYQPGKSYEITVTVESVHLENGGFQMASRFEDGTQAGVFEWNGERLMYTPSISDDVKYLQHSREGTTKTGEREISWKFYWIAPESDSGNIIFNIAANAGNDDDSAFGDWIYVKEIELSAPR